MTMSTFEQNRGEAPDPSALAVSFPDGRVVPAEHIGGIAEVARLLGAQERFAGKYPGGIPRMRVSQWASRWQTTGFPAPLPFKLGRGNLWDLREVATWSGPPGRWRHGAWVED